ATGRQRNRPDSSSRRPPVDRATSDRIHAFRPELPGSDICACGLDRDHAEHQQPAAPAIPPIEERMVNVLEMICSEKRPCKACGAQLYFVRNPKTGGLIPYTAGGYSHFRDCPAADKFGRN